MSLLQHEFQPLGWIVRIERHVRAARLRYGEHGHDEICAALHEDAHGDVRDDVLRSQVSSEPIGSAVELGISEQFVFEIDRNRIRCDLDALFEKLVQV